MPYLYGSCRQSLYLNLKGNFLLLRVNIMTHSQAHSISLLDSLLDQRVFHTLGFLEISCLLMRQPASMLFVLNAPRDELLAITPCELVLGIHRVCMSLYLHKSLLSSGLINVLHILPSVKQSILLLCSKSFHHDPHLPFILQSGLLVLKAYIVLMIGVSAIQGRRSIGGQPKTASSVVFI